MWAFIASFIYWLIALSGIALLGAYLAGMWLDYADGHSESRMTDRLNDAIERELFDI